MDKGKNIHILEKDQIPGGACDGYLYDGLGYVMRGGREMDNHFECMWDLFHSIPSIETEGVSVLDEYYWLNKEDPNYSLMRATMNRGEDAHTDRKFDISDKGAMEIMKLFFTPDEDLYDKKITDYFSDEVLNSNFWLYWRTMFAFENWHSALEMTALRFTKYNQYESMILPMIEYLKKYDVQFHYGTKVENVKFEISDYKKVAKSIIITKDGEESSIDLTENDLVFITNGGCVENSSMGSQNTPAVMNKEIKAGGGWDLWRKIAEQDSSFGNPDKFCYDPELTNWMSATVTTLDDRIPPYVQKICKRDPFSGKVVFSNVPGNYVKKPMRDCTGKEICMEWLYHLGVPENQIEELAENSANTIPVMMPYIDAFFMPRNGTDRPKVVPNQAVNFAFLGQFAETERDTIFTTEYSIRTAMVAVYTLLNVDRGVPEVWGSTYDIRDLLNATVKLRDGKPITEMNLGLKEKIALKEVLKQIKGTDIEKLLKEYHVIKDDDI